MSARKTPKHAPELMPDPGTPRPREYYLERCYEVAVEGLVLYCLVYVSPPDGEELYASRSSVDNIYLEWYVAHHGRALREALPVAYRDPRLDPFYRAHVREFARYLDREAAEFRRRLKTDTDLRAAVKQAVKRKRREGR